VTRIDGTFERGDAIAIATTEGHEIGRGLTAYSSNDARLILGHKTTEILYLLGYRGRDEVIHRDDLVMN
jgi:glutamate 5-kinase